MKNKYKLGGEMRGRDGGEMGQDGARWSKMEQDERCIRCVHFPIRFVSKPCANNEKLPDEIAEFTRAYMLENNPVGAWLQEKYEITNSKADIVQRTDLFNAFITDSGIAMTQKVFSSAIKQCNIQDKTLAGIRYYYGIRRNE